ncbi:MAG: hypothetical protein IRY94_04355, partial [Rhodospirillaceae bacterium]|nr:hypothetical protein [Rhodospirillaceae bacterium]
LAALRFLRGTPLDPFGHTADRRAERRLVRDYEALVLQLIDGLSRERHSLAVDIAAVPERIRGYGHVKRATLAEARARQAALVEALRAERVTRAAAE